MIVEFKSLFSDSTNQTIAPETRRPLINDLWTSENTYINQQPENYQQVLKYIRKSPEALAIFNAIATDIASDGFYFTPYKKQGSKTNIENAFDFTRANSFKSQFKAGVIDWLMLGNAAWWMGISNSEAKEHIKDKLGVEWKGDFYDEQFNQLRTFQHAAWSTMYILHDEENITSYKQVVGTGDNPIVDEYGKEIEGKRSSSGTKDRIWKPESIIHAKFMNFDGKVYGYTPTFSLLPVISTQALLKDYLGNYFQNGGVPDWMFILPNEIANSPNVKRLEQMLQEYKSSTQKHGNMVIPGEVKTEAMNEFNKDMEFRALAVYYTAILAFAFNMPMGRLQAILGMENKAKESDIAAESYWRTISEAQDYFEDLFNTQLFIPHFKVELKFKKTYKQDEIRESQNLLFLQNYVEGMNRVLYANKKQFSENYIKKIFRLEDEDLMEAKEPPMGGPQMNQNFETNEKNVEGNQQTRREKKVEQQKVSDRKQLKERREVLDVEIKQKELDILEKKEYMESKKTKLINKIEKKIGNVGD